MNVNLSTNELIAKLKKISKMHDEILAIQSKMERYEPTDEYARSVEVPSFPGKHKTVKDREAWKAAVDHTDPDAEEIMSALFAEVNGPKKPTPPVLRDFEAPKVSVEVNNKKEKCGCLFKLGLGVAAFFFLGIFVGGVIGSGALPTVLVIIAIALGVSFYFKKQGDKVQADIDLERAQAKEEHELNQSKILTEYNEALKAYENTYRAFEQTRDRFMQDYRQWREVYLKHMAEEARIAAQLENERVAEVKRIRAEEYVPACQRLEEYNDLVSDSYLPVIDTLIDLLMSGRADDLKEAINLYEEIQYRERQLELKRQQEAQRQREEQLRREEEKRRYEEEKRFREEQEYQRRREEDRRRDDEERRHREEMRAREIEDRRRDAQERERIRKEEYKAHMSRVEQEQKQRSAGQAQCRACAHVGRCNMSIRNSAPTCAGFTPR